MSDMDNRLRASLAARMLMPREEGHDSEALKRMEEHLLALRERAIEGAVIALDNNDRTASHDHH